MDDQGQGLVSLTADIVAAHVANNTVSISDIGTLVANVHRALSDLSVDATEATENVQSQISPVVSVRASIKPDSLTCLVCGKKQKTLKRHIGNAHQMTPAEYREAFGLKPDYPMVAPNYSSMRSELARNIGLGQQRRKAGEAPKKRGRKAKTEASVEG